MKRRNDNDILLGYQIGTGDAVHVPLRNTIVCGQTQEAGKTTALEALIDRSGGTALAFVTKRGEQSFAGGRRVQPYFRDRADWQFVDQILEAQLREKNKFLRPWIIKICRNTKTLADVHREVKKALATAKGVNEGVYTQLDAYLDLIVPEIGRRPLAKSLGLSPGLNVMDVSDYATPMQMLFVQSAIDWINDFATNTIVVIPEAWEFIPEGKGSPVKQSAISLVRKGSGIGNRIFVDSQDLAGVDKTIVRGCPLVLLGVQREPNEIKRTLASLHAPVKPRPADVAGQKLGQFYSCWGDNLDHVYVQPAWMSDAEAKAIARGGKAVETVRQPAASPPSPPPSEPPSTEESPEMSKALEEKLDRFMEMMMGSRQQTPPAPAPASVTAPTALPAHAAFGDAEEALYQRFKVRLVAEIPVIAAGGPITITPPEKLRKDFQRQEAERIIAAARALSPLAKRVLKLIETLGDTEVITQGTVANRFGRNNTGNAAATLRTAIENLASVGFIETRKGVGAQKSLRKKIAGDLAFYHATDAEIEAVYQNVLVQVAIEAE